MPELILASASPQRQAILASLGLRFEVRPADLEELEAGVPGEVALENARRKAQAVAADGGRDGAVVLAADTVVALEGRLYGKPRDAEEARSFLLALAGATHSVVTGLCVLAGGEERSARERTEVTMREFDASLHAWYLGSGEWRGRAGGYAIQGRGAALVSGIRGDLTNVIGLPVAATIRTLQGLLSVPGSP